MTAESDRQQHIVHGATAVFLRYGYARTTMGDIAKEAGLARPTLYTSFADKQAIFRAVVEEMVKHRLAELRQGQAGLDGLAERLTFLCESWSLHGYALVRANPDSADLFDLNFAVVRESYSAFEALLAEVLAEAAAPDTAPTELARMISAAMKGFKDVARDEAELTALIRALTEMIARALRR